MTIQRGRETPHHTLEWLLSLRWLRRGRVRDVPSERLCAVARHAAEAGCEVARCALCSRVTVSDDAVRPRDAAGSGRVESDRGALTDYDLFEDVIVKIRFERLTRKEQHDQLRRVVAWAREQA